MNMFIIKGLVPEEVGKVRLDPVRALYFAAILNGLAAPPLILVMLLLSRAPDVCGDQTG